MTRGDPMLHPPSPSTSVHCTREPGNTTIREYENVIIIDVAHSCGVVHPALPIVDQDQDITDDLL